MTTATTPNTAVADVLPPAPGRFSRRGPRVAVAVVITAALTAAGAVWADAGRHSGSHPGSQPALAVPAAPAALPDVPAPSVALAGLQDGKIAWQAPLRLTVTDGAITTVTATDATGQPVPGAVGPDGAWSSTATLIPATSYHLTARVTDANNVAHEVPAIDATSAPAAKNVAASLLPGDGAVVGVGTPVIVRLSTPVSTKPARAAIEGKLQVATVPAVEGGWRWISDREVHWRPVALWAPGTTVSVTSDLNGVQVAGDTWGAGLHTAHFAIGDALTSTVDVAAHTMTVSRNGTVVRVMKASMGRPQFPTRNGTFIVLEKFADLVMDSATVDLPPGTPAYKTAVKDAVRITNSGTFTHGAPWSVPSQGVRNVSHGCVNLSPADAHWFYLQAKRGDVVTVINSTTGPVQSDAGSMDWNMPFAQWQQGSALA